MAPDGGPEPTAPAPGDGGADLARRRFFRQFAGEIAQTAATVVGAAQALQRTSAELAGALLDPTRLEQPPPRPSRPPLDAAAAGRDRPGLPDRVPDGRRDDPVRRPADAAAVAHRRRRVVRGRGDLRDPRTGVLGGPADRPGGRARAGADRGARPRHEALRPAGDVRGAANALRNAAPASGSVEAGRSTRVMAAYAAVGELSEDGDAIAAAMQAEADAIVAEAIDGPRPARRGRRGTPRRVATGRGRRPAAGPRPRARRDARRRPVRDGAGDRDHRPPARDPDLGRRPGGPAALHRAPGRLLGAGRGRRPAPARRRRGRAVADRRGEIDVVLVGADRVAANGDVAAAIGTYPLAVVAARHGVPFIACVAASTLDLATPDGSAISTGYLDAEELDRIEKVILAPPGTETRVPTLDVTPAELVTTWLTATGPRTPPFAPPARPEPADGARRRSPRLMASVAIPGRRTRGALTVQTISDRAVLRAVPRDRPPLRRLRALRPRGPRVRPDPLGRRVRRRPARRARPRVLRADAAAAVRRWAAPDGIEAILRDVIRPRAAYVAALPESLPAVETAVPPRPGAADGPDVGRPGALPAVPGRRPAPAPGRDRRAQPALPARLRLVAAVVGDRRGRLLRDPRRRPAGRRGGDARRSAARPGWPSSATS